ncbi:MAG: inositol monophosphatase family protein [Thermodesulfovibrionales bacterium]|jgi:myo-inositol-1(or 4)-monophosphatase
MSLNPYLITGVFCEATDNREMRTKLAGRLLFCPAALRLVIGLLRESDACGKIPEIAMYLAVLRNIREKLLARLSEERFKPLTQKAIGVGAAGDQTFPIDRIAEDTIFSTLESSGLPFSVISEEYGHKEINGGGRNVLIDPIDGSKNAISGIPFYCTSIAIADGETLDSIVAAYVINLITGDEFRAEKDGGAFLNNALISAQKDEEFYLIAYEAQTPGKDISRIIPLLARSRKTRCFGATALDLVYLACGSISVFVNPSFSRSFDFAGGWLLVREAGGIFTDMKGEPIGNVELGLRKSVSLLASGNERLHDKALRILNG